VTSYEYETSLSKAYLQLVYNFGHTGLLYKLCKIGIDGNLLSWVTDYLDDRKQKVVLDGFSSGWEGIDAGVPQGSVLGPLVNKIDSVLLGLNLIAQFCDQL
jgi:hypothetical protein